MLQSDIKRLGAQREDGKYVVKYGVLFVRCAARGRRRRRRGADARAQDATQDTYEALLGTMIAARKRGVVDFKGQMLLKGAHDKVDIVLLQEASS